MPTNDFLTRVLDLDPNYITNGVIVVCVLIFLFMFLPWRWTQRMREIAPTLMVSAGIIGTFWGTFIALGHFETRSPEGGLDHKAMVESIPTVLEGMKTAFITTLIGLFSAFITRVVLKFRPESEPEPFPIEKETIELLESIRKGLYSNDGKTLLPQLTAGFENLNNNMQGLVGTIENSLVTSMKDLMQELREVIVDQLTEQLQETNKLLHTQLSEMLDRIEEALINQFGETFRQFNEATQAIKKWQEEHRQHVEELTEAFEKTAQGIEDIRANCESIPETMEQLKNLMGELDQRLQAFANMKEQAEQSFPVIKQHLDTIGNDLSKSAAGFSGLDETIRDIMVNSKKVASEYQEMIKGMLEAVKEESNNMIAEVRNASAQNQDQIREIVVSAQRESDSCVSNTAEAVRRISEESAQKTNDAMAAIAGRWGENMVGIAQRMAETINNQRK